MSVKWNLSFNEAYGHFTKPYFWGSILGHSSLTSSHLVFRSCSVRRDTSRVLWYLHDNKTAPVPRLSPWQWYQLPASIASTRKVPHRHDNISTITQGMKYDSCSTQMALFLYNVIANSVSTMALYHKSFNSSMSVISTHTIGNATLLPCYLLLS